LIVVRPKVKLQPELIIEGGHHPVARFCDGGIRKADNHNVILYSPYAGLIV
jgi:hypothetical protein